MALAKELLALLACPRCQGPLDSGAQQRGGPGDEQLVCAACRVAYPVEDGIPVLLADAARPLEGP